MNRAEKRRQQKLAEKAAKNARHRQSASPSPGSLERATQHHAAGRLPEAEELYQQILQADPNHPVALHLLGVIAHQVGKSDIAEGLITKALAINPDYAEAHYNLGLALKELNKLDGAVASYRKAIANKSDYVEAHSNLGSILQEQNKLDEAVESYLNALAIRPDYAEAHNNLGNTLKQLNKPEEAVASYRNALAIKPDYAAAHYNLGFVLQEMGKSDDAVASYRKALAFKPDNTDAHNNLGNLLKDQGLLEEAMACYHNALAINVDYAEAHFNLGNALLFLGKVDEAFNCHRRAVALNPDNELFWGGMAASLEVLSFSTVDDNLWQDLSFMLERPTVRPSSVAPGVVSALLHHPAFLQVLELTSAGKRQADFAYGEAAEMLSGISLFLRIMSQSSIDELKAERMLTFLRQAMLRETMDGKADEKSLPFSTALALQCFANEYVFPEADEEVAALERLQQQIATLVEKKQDVPQALVATLGAYRPLYKFPWAEKLCERAWGDPIKEVIERQITEPLAERVLRSQIPCLTAIEGTVSQSVRDQYEENPYPRWIKNCPVGKGKSIGSVLRDSPLRFDIGDYVSPEEPEILVAGCGTGQNALDTTARFSGAHVCAVDLSLSSLSYALRKTNELGLSNIEYAQADIMELGATGRQFDLIICDGVLHHLGDPLAGWQTLVNILRPGSFMKISLYSETARRCVLEGRALIAQKGYSGTGEDIRRCRQDIIALAEDGNARMAEIVAIRDFYSLSECRDLLFHVQEHRFTLPQIDAALRGLGLEFLGFELRNQSALRKFNKTHTDKQALTSLPLWHEFELENPDTFLGMYQFWCKKI